MSLSGGMELPWTEWQTDVCENIAFAQLNWWVIVTIPTIAAPLIPSQRMWLALVVFLGEAVVHQNFLSLGIVCMTVDETSNNNNSTNLTEYEVYYSDWEAGWFPIEMFCLVVNRKAYIISFKPSRLSLISEAGWECKQWRRLQPHKPPSIANATMKGATSPHKIKRNYTFLKGHAFFRMPYLNHFWWANDLRLIQTKVPFGLFLENASFLFIVPNEFSHNTQNWQ